MAYRRSVLKWAGGKYFVLKHILSHFPQSKRLVEPFLGGASVFLNTHYPSYLLAEINPDLFHFFKWMQHHGTPFIQQCEKYFTPEGNIAEQYYALRDLFNKTQNPELRAQLFLYLNRHGYNGLCRYNKKNQFNVPFGRYQKVYFPEQEMNFFHQKSQQAELILADFEETFTKTETGDLIYCDPPYVPLSPTAKFTSYHASGFSEIKQEKLAELSRIAANTGKTVILSNHDTPRTRALYEGAEIYSFRIQRNISQLGNYRKPVNELIAIFNGV